jgi:hypothetical protein
MKYKGPDEKYLGRDICYSYNEDTLTIYDVTDPSNSSIISVTSYEGATYTHQVSQTAILPVLCDKTPPTVGL